MTTVLNAHIWGRQATEFYVEPERCTVQLLQYEGFQGIIHDPCCGTGNIPRMLTLGGYAATGSYIVAHPKALGQPWFLGEGFDFFKGPTGLFGADNCVMNPPFAKGALELAIRRALDLALLKVCIFAPLSFLSGKERYRSAAQIASNAGLRNVL